VREEVCWRVQPGLFPLRDSASKLFCIPIDYDGGEQVESCDPKVLAFCGAVSDFALATDPQGTFQSMVRLTFIESNVGTALHVRVERPFDDEECPFNPPDFAQGNGQVMLPRPAAWWERIARHWKQFRRHPNTLPLVTVLVLRARWPMPD